MFRLAIAAWLFCACAHLLAGPIKPLASGPIKSLASEPLRAVDDLDHVTIEGVVTDANGKVIVNALVVARQVNTSSERSATTVAEGRYRLTALTPGVYELRAEADGFQTARHEK